MYQRLDAHIAQTYGCYKLDVRVRVNIPQKDYERLYWIHYEFY